MRHIYLTLPVNNQNNRKRFKSNPYIRIETNLNDQKILGWCAISAKSNFWSIILLRYGKSAQLLGDAQRLFLA